MIARIGVATVALLALFGGPAWAQQTLGWRVEPQHFVRYKVTGLKPAKKGEKLNAYPIKRLGRLWYELNHTGDKWPARGRHIIPLAMAIQLPDTRVPKGGMYQTTRRFEGMPYTSPTKVVMAAKNVGPGTFVKLPCTQIRVRGKYMRDADDKKDTQRDQLQAGGMDGSLYYHAERGHLIGGDLHVWYQLTTYGKPGKPARLVRHRFRFEMDLVLKLDDRRLDTMVDGAIKAGVKFLRSKQKKDGHWPSVYNKSYPMGQTALSVLALLASDVKPDDPAVTKGTAYFTSKPFKKTYGASLALMALEALYSPSAEKLQVMDNAALRKALEEIPSKVTAAHRSFVDKAVQWFLNDEDYARRWGYPHAKTHSSKYDNSNSQYAVLGLLAAQRLGARVPPSIWTNVMGHWLAEQDTSGPEVDDGKAGTGSTSLADKAKARGWNYRRRSRGTGGSYGSMTCAGVASLAICRSVLTELGVITDKKRTKLNEAIRDGLAWLQHHYDLLRNPLKKKGAHHYYYLYGLERAGVLTRAKMLGVHDWYREGAAHLVTWRKAKTAWGNSPLLTCYALLFLKRATTPLITTGSK